MVTAVLVGGPCDGQVIPLVGLTFHLLVTAQMRVTLAPTPFSGTPFEYLARLMEHHEYCPVISGGRPVVNGRGEVFYVHHGPDWKAQAAALTRIFGDTEAEAEDQDERDALATARAERQTASVDWAAHRAAARRACAVPDDPTAILELPDF